MKMARMNFQTFRQDSKSSNASSHSTGRLLGALVVCKAKSRSLRIVWAAIYLVCLVGFVAHMCILIQRYTAHPINVDTKYTTKRIPFPDVTICNTVAVSLGKMMYNLTAFEETNAFKNSSLDHFADVKYLKTASKQTLYDIYRRIENMLYVSLSDQFGHGDYIIVQCLYKEDFCDRKLIKEVKIPGYGNCFTLPSPGDVEESGEHGGYRMVLFTEGRVPNETWFSSYNDRINTLSEFKYSMLKPVGMKIIVHEKDSYPDPGSGTIVTSGYYWNMAIEPKWTTRDPATLIGCTGGDRTHIKYRDYLTGEINNYSYTLEDCRKVQLQRYWFETCGCLSEDYPIPYEVIADSLDLNTKKSFDNFCFFSFELMADFTKWKEYMKGPNGSTAGSKFNCAATLLKHQERRDVGEWEGVCKAPCEERRYRVSHSQGRFGRDMPFTHYYLHANLFCEPPEWFLNKTEYQSIIPTLNDLCEAYHRNHPKSELQLLRENFLQLHIYFQSGIVKHVTESSAYPLSNLFSDIGGILGLYVGVSAVTLCEILQYCIKWVELGKDKKQSKGDESGERKPEAGVICPLQNDSSLQEISVTIHE
ncbi:FMRFamide-activated amiloride-sensitive sodium channel-like [Lineus longissimus]|uniref:FMRFamide-activated amiloride-sensitive sodium channel-like n=1 Tax=Lineus longissimus TaxID=88925 RepID=UPI002B4E82D8